MFKEDRCVRLGQNGVCLRQGGIERRGGETKILKRGASWVKGWGS